MAVYVAKTTDPPVRPPAQEPPVTAARPPLPLGHRPVRILEASRAVPRPLPPLAGVRVAACIEGGRTYFEVIPTLDFRKSKNKGTDSRGRSVPHEVVSL